MARKRKHSRKNYGDFGVLPLVPVVLGIGTLVAGSGVFLYLRKKAAAALQAQSEAQDMSAAQKASAKQSAIADMLGTLSTAIGNQDVDTYSTTLAALGTTLGLPPDQAATQYGLPAMIAARPPAPMYQVPPAPASVAPVALPGPPLTTVQQQILSTGGMLPGTTAVIPSATLSRLFKY